MKGNFDKYIPIKNNFYSINNMNYEYIRNNGQREEFIVNIYHDAILSMKSCGTLKYSDLVEEPSTGAPTVAPALSFAPPTNEYDSSAVFASALKAAEDAAKLL
jgi:hypothetical protein